MILVLIIAFFGELIVKKINDISTLNKMIISLVDLLEENDILTHKEWDERVKKELEEAKDLKRID